LNLSNSTATTTNFKWSTGLTTEEATRDAINTLNELISTRPYSLVVIENFRNRAGRATATAGFINIPERLIAITHTLCWVHNVDILLVEPNDHKSYRTDKKLELFRQAFKINQPKVTHERDALSIALYGMYKLCQK
jgi:hypothetical protein